MNVEVVQLLQEMNFATRQTTTFIVLGLPNGKRVRVPVDASTAEAIINADVDANGTAPAEVLVPSSVVEAPPEDDDAEDSVPEDYVEPPPSTIIEETETQVVRVFGEETEQTPSVPKKKGKRKNRNDKRTPAEVAEVLTAPEPPPEPRAVPKYPEPQGTRHYKELVKNGKLQPNAYAKHVPKDEYGYPIVRVKEGTADPQAVVGTQNQDEDGVGSV